MKLYALSFVIVFIPISALTQKSHSYQVEFSAGEILTGDKFKINLTYPYGEEEFAEIEKMGFTISVTRIQHLKVGIDLKLGFQLADKGYKELAEFRTSSARPFLQYKRDIRIYYLGLPLSIVYQAKATKLTGFYGEAGVSPELLIHSFETYYYYHKMEKAGFSSFYKVAAKIKYQGQHALLAGIRLDLAHTNYNEYVELARNTGLRANGASYKPNSIGVFIAYQF